MEADEQGPVDVACRQVVADHALVRGRLRHHQDQLAVPGGEGGADTPQEAGEERVREDLAAGLRDDDGDRVVARARAARLGV